MSFLFELYLLNLLRFDIVIKLTGGNPGRKKMDAEVVVKIRGFVKKGGKQYAELETQM